MSMPPGRSIPFSPARRLIAEIMHFSRGVPLVTVERRVTILEVANQRLLVDPRPSWLTLFVKAAGLAAQTVPELRRSYLSFPWPWLYEHSASVPAITVERDWHGEPAVLILPLRQPEHLPLSEIDRRLKKAKSDPLRDIPAFRRTLRIARYPLPLRRLLFWLGLRVVPPWRERHFGTIAVSSVITAGAEITSALTPLTGYLTFSTVEADGSVTLRLMFDHRVLDAAQAARYLVAFEQSLRREILQELQSIAQAGR